MEWSLPESVSISISISVPVVLELGLAVCGRFTSGEQGCSSPLSPGPGRRDAMCDEGRVEDDCAGLKNLNNVCCRESTVSGVGSGSESISLVSFSGSFSSRPIQGVDTCRCWAV